MKEVITNNSTSLGGNVRIAATNLAKTTGTIYAVLKLDFPGDADDGCFWDASDSSWRMAPVTYPSATYIKSSWWQYAVPNTATTGKQGGVIVLVELTDNVATPGSATVYSNNCEELGIVSASREVNLTQIDSQITAACQAALNLRVLNVQNPLGDAIVAQALVSGNGLSVMGLGR